MDDNYLISQRDQGGKLPLSLGTAMAFEPCLETGIIKQYDNMLINLRTLVRNMLSSAGGLDYMLIKPEVVLDTITEELNVIAQTIGNATLVLYCSEYKDRTVWLPGSLPPVRRGGKKYLQEEVEQTIITYSMNNPSFRMVKFNGYELDFPVRGSALLLSHIVPDLFSRYQFTKFDLLESYSGVIKPRSEWHTKLTDGRNLKTIPFNKFTLSLFGDKNVMIGSQPIKLRKAIHKLSTERKWTTITTMSEIKKSIKTIEDSKLKTELLAFSSPYL